MWVLRILSGQQSGQTWPLKLGSHTIGRGPQCSVKIANPGISKEHAKIDVLPDKVIITDLGSRNGTFVNGVQVKTHRIHPNDKIMLNDIVLDIIPMTMMHGMPMGGSPYPHHQYGGFYHGNVAYQQTPQPEGHYQPHPTAAEAPQGEGLRLVVPQGLQGIVQVAKHYVDDVVLPGVYKLAEWMELRWVLALFMGAFIVFVTSLSSVPLMRILKTSIEQESQRRALTIARTIARVNRPALMQGLESAINVELAQREPGVDEALIVSNIDGNIIAPASKAGRYPDNSFVHRARQEGKEIVEQLDDDTIGALVPIEFYNSNTGSQTINAYAVVIYNMGALAVDDGRTLSLFIQTLFIALIVGGILFFFMYKLIEFPFKTLNTQIDNALKDGHDSLQVNYQFVPLQTLISNVNSALARAASGGSQQAASPIEHDRSVEMGNLVQLVGFPAIAIMAEDQKIGALNPAFEERTGITSGQLLHQSVESITDQALRLSIIDLMERVSAQPDQMATNDLEIGGYENELFAQAVYGSNRIAYFLIVLLPKEGGQG